MKIKNKWKYPAVWVNGEEHEFFIEGDYIIVDCPPYTKVVVKDGLNIQTFISPPEKECQEAHQSDFKVHITYSNNKVDITLIPLVYSGLKRLKITGDVQKNIRWDTADTKVLSIPKKIKYQEYTIYIDGVKYTEYLFDPLVFPTSAFPTADGFELNRKPPVPVEVNGFEVSQKEIVTADRKIVVSFKGVKLFEYSKEDKPAVYYKEKKLCITKKCLENVYIYTSLRDEPFVIKQGAKHIDISEFLKNGYQEAVIHKVKNAEYTNETIKIWI